MVVNSWVRDTAAFCFLTSEVGDGLGRAGGFIVVASSGCLGLPELSRLALGRVLCEGVGAVVFVSDMVAISSVIDRDDDTT